MHQLRKHWPAITISLIALWIFHSIVSQRATSMFAANTFEPSFESGKWAIRWLLISLSMTPLRTYLGWRQAIKLRKPAGLWAFGFASLHVWLTLKNSIGWIDLPLQPFIVYGLVGLGILALLALTSNRWSMRRLGKNWKRLHRTVYFAGAAVIYHAILATSSSKLLLLRDPNAVEELNVYVAVLTILLFVRIPLVKRRILSSPVRPFRKPQTVTVQLPQEQPATVPTEIVFDWSKVEESHEIATPQEKGTETTEADKLPMAQ
ncbi:MAG: hypothetical protein HND51_03590 [Chloroflexi bacterium]|nr:hypothetical protein [Chloroflexota bacterium]